MPNPRYPIYIPTKSRAAIALTPRYLDEIDVPYRLIVEADQADEYAEHFPRDRILILDPAFQDEYDTCDDLARTKSLGPGPARNYAWSHALAEGHPYHWVMDDNIKLFARLHQNRRIPVGDGTIFHAMETFTLRYRNVAMSGPNYWMFAPSRTKHPPFTTGTRIYSCNLIRNDVPFRWRGRYNEDTILSLDLLKAAWNTIQFNAFLQWKLPTQTLPGGNTEAFYAHEGTLAKSRMLVEQHPDAARLVYKFHRWHHHVDYTPYRSIPLLRDPDHEPENHDYTLTLRPRPKP